MYATHHGSVDTVAFLLKKTGFNSLTDVDEVYYYIQYLMYRKCDLCKCEAISITRRQK